MKLEAGIVRRRARVEMIPLIDCVFILLVFFIYSMLAMTVQRGLVVQLPGASAAEPNRDEAAVVTITSRGTLMLDDQAVTFDELPGAVEAARRRADRVRFVINADRQAEHGWVVHALDELRSVGVTQVMILSEESDQP